ncbi:MAG: hypothetical protein J5835_04435 [Bacteroidales bacterium]|nr:hypothetical protein [Bacteroidales bacterium]
MDYELAHWLQMYTTVKAAISHMVEVPAGVVTVRGKDYKVGKFKIAKSLVTRYRWGQVMERPDCLGRKPVTGIPYMEAYAFVKRLMDSQMTCSGFFSIPTEAQFELARQNGLIHSYGQYREFCYTTTLGPHHYVDNIPANVPFDLAIRRGDERSLLPYDQPDQLTGFRLVLVGYDKKLDGEFLKNCMESF